MRKWLKTLNPKRVIEIAHDYGYERFEVGEAIDFIMEEASCYGWRIADLKARYPDL